LNKHRFKHLQTSVYQNEKLDNTYYIVIKFRKNLLQNCKNQMFM